MLRNILFYLFYLFFFYIFFKYTLKRKIIKRKLQHSVDLSKFMTLGPLGHYMFLHRIKTFVARNRLLLNLKK